MRSSTSASAVLSSAVPDNTDSAGILLLCMLGAGDCSAIVGGVGSHMKVCEVMGELKFSALSRPRAYMM